MGYRVTSRQLAVGQGGFMTTEITARLRHRVTSRFSFVFDCGSVNREHLEEGLEGFEGQDIDLLFISHLDADHVNGIDLLLAKASVHTVILPCLDALTATVLISKALSGSTLTGNLRSVVLDPIQWFADRGVKQVYFLTRDSDAGDDGGAPSFTPDDDGPGNSARELRPKNPQDASRMRVLIHSEGGIQNVPGSVAAAVLKPASDINVQFEDEESRRTIRWLLVPYVHPFAEGQLKAFRAAVRKVLSVPDDESLASPAFIKRLKGCLLDEGRRKKLRDCYFHLSSNHNKTSLSLFSGPYPRLMADWSLRSSNRGAWRGNYFFHRSETPSILSYSRYNPDLPAWLCTGDADLQSARTREAWLRRFDQLLEYVGVFQLPHHGSNSSIHEEVLERVRYSIHLACAAMGRKHHPHATLVAYLRSQERALWQVSEHPPSEFSASLECD